MNYYTAGRPADDSDLLAQIRASLNSLEQNLNAAIEIVEVKLEEERAHAEEHAPHPEDDNPSGRLRPPHMEAGQ